MKKYPIILLLSLFPIISFSQMSFMAEVRPRFYFDHGYKNPDVAFSDTKIYLSQRSGLACNYQNKKITAYIHMRDARVWGDDNLYGNTGQSGNSNSMVIHQSWINLHLETNLSIKTGRQILAYDDERVLSARNWNDFQVTYDAVKILYKIKNSNIDGVLSWNNSKKASVYFPAQRIKSTNFIHYKYQNKKSDFTMLFLISGKTESDTSTVIAWKNTFGTGYSYYLEKWRINVNLYLQNNFKTPDYCLSAKAERTAGNWKIAVGADILSGSNNHSAGFDILYGKRHGYYGYMDYFNTTPKNGLVDIFAKTSWKPSEKLLLSLQCHEFTFHQRPEDAALSRSLGQELDFTMKYQFTKEVSLQPGYSIFLPTKTFEIEKSCNSGLGVQQFIYLTINGKFNTQD